LKNINRERQLTFIFVTAFLHLLFQLFNHFHVSPNSIFQSFKNLLSVAKENLLFEVITMFWGGGCLWRRVAPVGDTQRVKYARNFAADNVTAGFRVAV
jgi:hypothetical protein